MSALGKLVASIVLDTAEFTKGTDKAQYEAAKAAAAIDKQFSALEKNITATAKNIAVALAAGFTINALKDAFNNLVQFRGALEKMSVVTGASVESLSKIGQGAKLAGTDLGTVEQALVKLTKGLSASNADTKDTSRALAYLGVSARTASGQLKDPGEVMLDIAKKLGGMADGSNKTALALALFGKAGAQMLPTLKELGENGDLIAKVTAEQAFQAREYEKALVRLGIAQGNIGRKIMGEMIVPLTTLIEVFTENMTAADSLSASVNKLSNGGELQSWAEKSGYAIATLVDVARSATNTILAIGGSVNSVLADVHLIGKVMQSAQGGDVAGLKSALDYRNSALEEGNKRWATLLNMNVDKTREAYEKQLKINKEAFAKKTGEDAARIVGPAFHGTDHVAGITKENIYRDENAQLDMQIQKLQGVGELEQYITKLSSKRYDLITPKERESLIIKEKYKIALERESSQMKADAKDHEEDLKWREAENAAIGKTIEHLEDEVEKLKFEATTIGLTNDQRQIALLQFEKELALRGDLTDMQRKAIDGLYDEKKAITETMQAGGKELSLWNEISDKGSKLFTDMLTSGKNAFSTLKDALKSFAKEMLAFFAKRYILQMAAGATGSGSLAAQAAGMDSGGGLVGSAVSGLGSLVGGTGIMSGIGSSLFGTAGTAGAGVLAESGTFATAGLLGTGGISATITSALAAIPVWGWIAIAALAAYAAFGGKGGGPKVEGSYMGNYGADGKLVDENPHRFFVGHAMDSASKQMSQGTAQTYAAYVSRFGGTAANTTFGFGSDSDPQGTAQNRVSGNAWVNGRQVFEQRDRNIGRDNSKIGEEMQLTAQRALIAALQATDMPGAIKKLFSGVDAYSITAAAATELLTKASAYADAFKALKDSLATIEAQMDGLSGNSIGALNTALKNLRGNVATATAAFEAAMKGDDPMVQVSAEQALLNAVVTRYNTEMSMIQTLQDAIAQARDGVYQFGQAMAGRYANVGRNVDTSGASQQRVSELQQNIYGTQDPAKRIGFASQALTAIYNWVTSSRAAVQRDFATKQVQMQADLQANQAIADARKKAIQTQIDGLNESIKLAGAFKSLAQQAAQAITQMSQSGANPLSVQGRLGMAGDSVQALLSQFRGSSGQGRIDSANQLMQQLQGRMALGGEAFQRPSDAYQKIYNEVISTYAEIRDSALSESQQALAVQQQIADLTQQQLDIDKAMVAYQSSQVDLTGQMNAALDAINAQAISQYEQFDAIGRQAYAQQERNAEIQLNAITGGMNVALYTAQLQTQTRDLLVQIRDSLQTAGGPVTVTVVVTPPGPGDTGPGEPGPGGGGGRRTTINDKPLRDLVEDVVLQTVTQLRRELQRA